jgi:hypothetical protein
MNAQPHTHKLVTWTGSSGSVHLTYGDQEAWIYDFGIFGQRRIFTVERRIPKVVHRLKKRHDRASVRAGLTHATTALALAQAREYVEKAGWQA